MYTLRIEHPVPDYDAWRRAFDSDPLDRRGSGVVRYRLLRTADAPPVVMVDLDFTTREEAEAMHQALLRLWGRARGEGLIGDGTARLAELVESAAP